jgi:uncharacterized Zn-finger protein
MQNIPSVETLDLVICSGNGQQYKCKKCDLTFFSEFHLRKHELMQNESESNDLLKKRLCKICNQIFATYRGMRQHMGKIHSSTKKVKCKFCHKRFKDNYAVKYHRKQVHDKVTQVSCHLCEKVLYNQYSLKKHLELCEQVHANFNGLEVQI